MVRTKHTTASGMAKQGEPAVFEPRNEAIAVSAYHCSQCDRRFSNKQNLNRHERQTHGTESLFKYPCPVSPNRFYSRRSDLREHFRIWHPEADLEEVEDVVPMEVPRAAEPTTSKRATPETSSPSPAPKKKKTIQSTSKTSESTSAAALPLSTAQIEAIEPGAGSRLVTITETIKIERTYTFQ